jgi:ABC-type multidrug transport system ATPase subunit
MEEADALCDAIAIVDAGRIAATGSPRRAQAELGGAS